MKLEDIVAVPFEDLETLQLFEYPPARFANQDILYKTNVDNFFFMFENEGQWNEDNISIPELNFETVFNEKIWLDMNNSKE